MRNKVLKRIIIVLTISIILTIFVYVYNETPFLYTEPQEYTEPDLSNLMNEHSSPIYYTEQSGKENATAIMFIHGFLGNPSDVRLLSEMAIEDGFDVITPLLPGSGTSPEDFKKTYYSQWYNYARDKYLEYRTQYKYFYIVGHSMGGTITLRIAEELSDSPSLQPTAIVISSAPVFLNSLIENGVMYNFGFYFVRMASWFTDGVDIEPHIISEDGADKVISYSGGYPKQGFSLKMGMKEAKMDLYKIKIPIFLAYSKNDKVVPFKNMWYIASKVESEKIKLKVYDLKRFSHSQHMLTAYDSTREDLYNEIIAFINQNKY